MPVFDVDVNGAPGVAPEVDEVWINRIKIGELRS